MIIPSRHPGFGLYGLAFLFACLAFGEAAVADEPATAASERAAEQFFEREIRPLLADRCYRCHGPDKQQGGLRLDSRAALLAGGESGAAAVPGKPAESLLLSAVQYELLEMPPDRQLDERQIAALERWIAAGAHWPGSDETAPVKRDEGFEISEQDRRFWSFQPVRPAPPPAVTPQSLGPWRDTGPLNPIDAFIAARLEAGGLQPAREAERRELVRRLYLDLVGLPPTKEQVDAFLADSAPDAPERLVDRLLAQPQYGERWGRHWLDVVRFAQTNGYERDAEKPFAWRYRDYVIRAWNEDKPFDRFVREHLAGDQLRPETDDGLIATAFYRLGVWDDEPDDAAQAEFDNLDDMLSTTGSAFLGLTIGCARCHDHKFDPVPQEDYYRLLAYLRNIKPYVKPEDKGADGTIFASLSGGEKTLAVAEREGDPRPTHVLIRGSAAQPGQQVEPGVPRVLVPREPGGSAISATSSSSSSSSGETAGRRRALADWISDSRNPLTARVLVNRLWHYHFGQGIVPTPSDFGRTGLPPSHPELLDYLAAELIRHDWRIKPVQRLIVTSRTYRQSSRVRNERAETVDPDNRLLWRQNLRRLEAEAIRDCVLAASGELNLAMGGRGIFPRLNPQVLATQSRPGSGWDESPRDEQNRRSVYIFVKRTLRVPLLETFDAASPDTTIAARTTTTIAPQALILLNSDFMHRRAAAMARRVRAEVGDAPRRQIARAFELALARDPSGGELEAAEAFFERQRVEFTERLQAEPSLAEGLAAESTGTLPGGWTAFGGRWQVRADGGLEVQPHAGAKAVWQRMEDLRDGEVRAQMLLGDRAGDAGLLVRVSRPRNGVDALHAYNINFQPGRVRLGKHQDNWRELASADYELERNAWHDVRVVLDGGRIQVYLGESQRPLIDYDDPQPLAAGKLGFRTYHADAALRNLRYATTGGKGAAPIAGPSRGTDRPADPADQLALAAVCRLILNLNEFVYVD